MDNVAGRGVRGVAAASKVEMVPHKPTPNFGPNPSTVSQLLTRNPPVKPCCAPPIQVRPHFDHPTERSVALSEEISDLVATGVAVGVSDACVGPLWAFLGPVRNGFYGYTLEGSSKCPAS